MPGANNYYFITRWRVKATAEEVYAILAEPTEFPRWWPSVYLGVRELSKGTPAGIGRRVRLHTKGLLPYTLLWESEVTEAERPHRLVIRASGDLNGRGIWSFVQDGEWCDATFDWKLTAEKPLLNALSFALKPAFEANHRWAMARGEESLNLELARARARTPEEINAVPAQPDAGEDNRSMLLAGGAVAAVLLGASFSRER